MEKKVVGFTGGVYDLFHVGHVNHLANAKSMCDHLIVGVSSDKLIAKKGKNTAIPYDQRVEVVRACKYVDSVIAQDDFDRYKMWEKLKFDITFIGDDYFENKAFREIERKLKKQGVKVVFFPYTKNVSSTLVQDFLKSEGHWTKDEDKKEEGMVEEHDFYNNYEGVY